MGKKRIEKLRKELSESLYSLRVIRDLCEKHIGKNKGKVLVIVVTACFKEELILKYPFSPLASVAPLEFYRDFVSREIKDVDAVKEERYIVVLMHPEKEPGIVSCYSFSIER